MFTVGDASANNVPKALPLKPVREAGYASFAAARLEPRIELYYRSGKAMQSAAAVLAGSPRCGEVVQHAIDQAQRPQRITRR